jgi:hypothetical protein
MESRSGLVLAAGIMSGLAVSLVCVTTALLWEGRSLRRQLAEASDQAVQWRARQSATDVELAAQRRQIEEVQAELERWRSAAEGKPESAESRSQALRARVYVGNRLAGLGWVMVPPADPATAGAVPGPAANVVLDAPVAAPPTTAGTDPSGAASGPQPGYAYHYAYTSPNPYYWPGYLLTSGWVDGPWCTNRDPADPHLPPFAPPPATEPAPTSPPSPSSPPPVTASHLRSPYLRPAPQQSVASRVPLNRIAPVPSVATTRNLPAALPAARTLQTVRPPARQLPLATLPASRSLPAPTTSAVVRR